MKFFVSQDRLKAIAPDKIGFFVINGERNERGKFNLLAKAPVDSNNFFDYLILFEHEDIEVVKNVMIFLANGQFLIPSEVNTVVVDLPNLYRCGLPATSKGDL